MKNKKGEDPAFERNLTQSIASVKALFFDQMLLEGIN